MNDLITNNSIQNKLHYLWKFIKAQYLGCSYVFKNATIYQLKECE